MKLKFPSGINEIDKIILLKENKQYKIIEFMFFVPNFAAS